MIIDKTVFETIVSASVIQDKYLRDELTNFLSLWDDITTCISNEYQKYMTIHHDRHYSIYLYAGSYKMSKFYNSDTKMDYDNDPEISVEELSQPQLESIINNIESNLKTYFSDIQNDTSISISLIKKLSRINQKLSEV